MIIYQNYEYNSGDAGLELCREGFWFYLLCFESSTSLKRGSGYGCLVDVIRCKVGSDDGAVDDYKEGGGDDDNDDVDEDDVAMQICE